MDGWMDGWINGWMDGQPYISIRDPTVKSIKSVCTVHLSPISESGDTSMKFLKVMHMMVKVVCYCPTFILHLLFLDCVVEFHRS